MATRRATDQRGRHRLNRGGQEHSLAPENSALQDSLEPGYRQRTNFNNNEQQQTEQNASIIVTDQEGFTDVDGEGPIYVERQRQHQERARQQAATSDAEANRPSAVDGAPYMTDGVSSSNQPQGPFFRPSSNQDSLPQPRPIASVNAARPRTSIQLIDANLELDAASGAAPEQTFVARDSNLDVDQFQFSDSAAGATPAKKRVTVQHDVIQEAEDSLQTDRSLGLQATDRALLPAQADATGGQTFAEAVVASKKVLFVDTKEEQPGITPTQQPSPSLAAEAQDSEGSDPYEKFVKTKSRKVRDKMHLDWQAMTTPFQSFVNNRNMLMMPERENLKPEMYPDAKFTPGELEQRFNFNRLKQEKISMICEWKQSDVKGLKKRAYIKSISGQNERILTTVEKDALEQLDVYEDTWPCLRQRKGCMRAYIYSYKFFYMIQDSSLFDNISICVILLNSVVMMAEDPSEKNPAEFFVVVDRVFLYLYTVEMVIKIMGLGLIFSEGSYLREPWNVLDFIIVASGYVPLVLDGLQASDSSGYKVEAGVRSGRAQGLDLTGMRVFRVLRPLKTIQNIRGLKVLMAALLGAVSLLLDTVVILVFFFVLYSIMGTQLLTGELKKRCVAVQTGQVHPDELMCGGHATCPGGYFCGKTNENPNNGATNFDNFMYSLLVVFQSVTLEGWSETQRMLQLTYSFYIFIFFLPLVFIGAFFLLNLTLAVINAKFNEAHKAQQQKDHEEQLQRLNAIDRDDGPSLEGDANLQDLKNDLTIFQFITAQKYAKKMIAFLNKRRQENAERQKALATAQGKRSVKNVDIKYTMNKAERRQSLQLKPSDVKHVKVVPTPKSKSSRSQLPDVKKEVIQEVEEVDDSNAQGDVSPMTNPSGQPKKKKKQIPPRQRLSKGQLDSQTFMRLGTFVPKQMPKQRSEHKQSARKKPPMPSGLKMKANLGLSAKNLPRKVFLEDGQSTPSIPESGRHQRAASGSFDLSQLDFENVIVGPPTPQDTPQSSVKKVVQIGSETLSLVKQESAKVAPEGVILQQQTKSETTPYQPQESLFLDRSDLFIDPTCEPVVQSQGRWIYGDDKERVKRKDKKFSKTTSTALEMQLAATQMAIKDSDEENDNKLQTSDSSVNQAIEERNKKIALAQMLERQGKTLRDLERAQRKIQKLQVDGGHTKVQLSYSRDLVRPTFRKIVQKQASFTQKQNSCNNSEDQQQPTPELATNALERKFFKLKEKSGLPVSAKRRQAFEEVFDMQGKKLVVVEENVPTAKPQNPFDLMDHKTEKVTITKGRSYQGTSELEIMEPRLKQMHNAAAKADAHIYVKLDQGIEPKGQGNFTKLTEQEVQDEPQSLRNQLEMEGATDSMKEMFVPDRQRINTGQRDPIEFTRNINQPYQQKIEFEVEEDSSEIEDANQWSDSDEAVLHQMQPFETITSVRFNQYFKRLPIKQLARRSDMVAMSTISMSVYPVDHRAIAQVVPQSLSHSQLAQLIDEKNAFNSLCLEHARSTNQLKDKDKEFRDNYLRSIIHRHDFGTKTMQDFKLQVKNLNRNKRDKTGNLTAGKVRDPEAVAIKHKQKIRAGEKHNDAVWDMKAAQQLLDGTYHDMVEGDVDQKDRRAIKDKQALNEFESQLHEIFVTDEERRRKRTDEIPKDLRAEFEIPEKMQGFQVDFGNIKKYDASRKKLRPMWSGQDVLPDHLNFEQSAWVVQHLNAIRVWPAGSLSGMVKRYRSVMRLIVRSTIFDHFLTSAVVLNTVVLAMNHYGISPEVQAMLDEYNVWFTYIFIVEMIIKLQAYGVAKYCQDTMHLLDGSVVFISVFEMAYVAAQQDDMNLGALPTVKLFRTFRVFRIARLLRGLESMQTILGVMGRSYKSFIYITVLLGVFIIIFSLLGMQLFGGYFDFPDGRPRGNFDSFGIACITVFQILTMENWISVLFDSMRSDVDKYVISLYYVAWIFLGNFILLNLFLAILLDSFLEEDEDGDNEAQLAQQARERAIRIEKRRARKQKRMVIMDVGKGRKKTCMAHVGDECPESDEDLDDLDEDQIMAILKQEGLMQMEASETRDKPLFVDADCEFAFYLFSKQNPLRIACYRLITSKIFDNAVMALIFLSSVKLGADTYFFGIDPDGTVAQTSEIIDRVFNFSFIIEMLLKAMALGFVMDNGSYLDDGWNKLDFFIVISSIIDMSASGLDLPAIKILRLLRTLRPLRVISHDVALKMIVSALFESVGGIFNVMIVVMMVWLIFAIMGVNFFGGRFQYCSLELHTLSTRRDCELAGGSWETYDQNFDDVLQAMTTLYIVSSLEGWPDIMLQAVDAVAIDVGPRVEAAPVNALFFVFFIMIGSFFLLNFFIGVLFLKYMTAQKEETKGYTAMDLAWQDIQTLILQSKPEYTTTNVPQDPLRKWFHTLVSSERFELIITAFIFLNMLQMMCLFESMSETWANILNVANYIFTTVFFIEAILKLIGYGLSYFDDSWNQFDFFVVVASIFDILLSRLDPSAVEFLQVGPQIARLLRVLRVTRVIRLFGRQEGLQAIIRTIIFSIPSLVNVTLLLLLFFFMFSLAGVFMFNEVSEGEVIDEIKNFNNFSSAFLLLFAISTGEDWNLIMFDCSRQPPDCIKGRTCGSVWAFPYFFILILVCSHIMLNLFILVIIQQFEKYYLPSDNMITTFMNDFEKFMMVWKEFTQARYNCLRIKENHLINFFRRLGEIGDAKHSLGFNEEAVDLADLRKQLLRMGIKSENGFVYFNELLYRVMRRKYCTFKLSKRMQIHELRTQYRLTLLTHRTMSSTSVKSLDNDQVYKSIVKKGNSLNPFLLFMNHKISFKTWLKHSKYRLRNQAISLLSKAGHDLSENPAAKAQEPQKHYITINQDVYFEVTSEEDEEEKKPEQAADPKDEQNEEEAEEPKMNHLDLFKRQMTIKLGGKRSGDLKDVASKLMMINKLKMSKSEGTVMDRLRANMKKEDKNEENTTKEPEKKNVNPLAKLFSRPLTDSQVIRKSVVKVDGDE